VPGSGLRLRGQPSAAPCLRVVDREPRVAPSTDRRLPYRLACQKARGRRLCVTFWRGRWLESGASCPAAAACASGGWVPRSAAPATSARAGGVPVVRAVRASRTRRRDRCRPPPRRSDHDHGRGKIAAGGPCRAGLPQAADLLEPDIAYRAPTMRALRGLPPDRPITGDDRVANGTAPATGRRRRRPPGGFRSAKGRSAAGHAGGAARRRESQTPPPQGAVAAALDSRVGVTSRVVV